MSHDRFPKRRIIIFVVVKWFQWCQTTVNTIDTHMHHTWGGVGWGGGGLVRKTFLQCEHMHHVSNNWSFQIIPIPHKQAHHLAACVSSCLKSKPQGLVWKSPEFDLCNLTTHSPLTLIPYRPKMLLHWPETAPNTQMNTVTMTQRSSTEQVQQNLFKQATCLIKLGCVMSLSALECILK